MIIPAIDSFEFGRMVVDGVVYNADVIIAPGGVRPGWWRKEGHSLHPGDLEDALTPEIEVVIIGCGFSGALGVPKETRQWLLDRGIELVSLPTAAACDRYNELSGSGKVLAGLHLTC